MLLIEPSLVRQRMFLQGLQEIEDNLKPCIEGAQAQIEDMWGTRFTPGSSTELFRVPSYGYQGVMTLRLSNALVAASPAPTIVYSEDSSIFTTSFTNLPTTAYRVQGESGFILVSDEFADDLIKVSYSYGVSSPSGVPEWLKEVLVLQSIIVASQAPNQSNIPTNLIKELQDKVYSMLDSNTRAKPIARRPQHVWS